MIRLSLASLALVLAASTLAGAALAGECPAHYLDGRTPEIRNAKLATATRELCYGVFGVMHSGLTRTPLWSAEYLKADAIASAQTLSRENSFHPEERLPRSERAELKDYARSGFDRGHMSPNGDMPDRRSQYESFTLANMVPQDADNNRHVWAGIEGAVRKMAKKDGALYVLTGPAFVGAQLQKVGNVLVPTHLYKAVWSPRQRAGAAWFVENSGWGEVRVMPVAELEQVIGINLLPSLSEQQKRQMLKLPKVKKASKSRKGDAW
ncbi:DNA/RNA non-specific endonuclease [Massilia arenosa]|uniref:Endonuclease n=1 Tax=Zemynaea arenosa TaxID=2561931 RepID=A0A4Y9RPS4_9BURK|nr:DNA/RNA non-specific endonuclease [Massilia arenosa]TFW11327.1 DNA/RNA non-specific endonuclease [Massilia arenosa]